MACSSAAATLAVVLSSASVSSRVLAPDLSSAANSTSTPRSSAAVCNSLSGLISRVSRRMSSTSSWALGGLSQKPGAVICSLIACARACLPARSKRVLQVLDPGHQVGAFFAQFVVHLSLQKTPALGKGGDGGQDDL